jgi:hypothetical protein
VGGGKDLGEGTDLGKGTDVGEGTDLGAFIACVFLGLQEPTWVGVDSVKVGLVEVDLVEAESLNSEEDDALLLEISIVSSSKLPLGSRVLPQMARDKSLIVCCVSVDP